METENLDETVKFSQYYVREKLITQSLVELVNFLIS